ncbi:SEL1-like repeat protein [Uliginosibacterium gangwonense]|uniref:SEL1-like repeat protein n=1 Tax=Uliginosibacterium gangwonense TaxID=392736 RepID=UPI000368FA64|nr:DUF6396 domain-containing protein [Uliginosibacterium gangwonense]
MDKSFSLRALRYLLVAWLSLSGNAQAFDWNSLKPRALTMNPFSAQSPLSELDPAQNGKVLPRNVNLRTFNPHRKDFSCVHEADKVPPLAAQAEALYQQALKLTSPGDWPDGQDWPQAMALARQAAELKHWKAIIFVAGTLSTGAGQGKYRVPRDTEAAVKMVEYGMQLGIPAAFDLMGTFHQDGTGVKQDISRAYALWEIAADLGNADAQAFLGTKFSAVYDRPPERWANVPVSKAMLECAYAQGNAVGAFELGTHLENVEADLIPDAQAAKAAYARALQILHDAVKFGSEEATSYMSAAFHSGSLLVGRAKDLARAERYSVLDDALFNNPDLRFPNLDKVLPLPPARLPKWDGDKQKLIDAAKGAIPAPKPVPAHPNTSLADPAYHIPAGYTLPKAPRDSLQGYMHKASMAGFWQPSLPLDVTEDRSRAAAQRLNALPARRYAAGEALASFEALHYATGVHTDWHDLSRNQLQGMVWHYFGEPIPLAPAASHPLVQRKVAIEIVMPQESVTCAGNRPCPRTGVWYAFTDPKHPLAQVFRQVFKHPMLNQAYVEAGNAFPSPAYLDIKPDAITWEWLGQENDVDSSGFKRVTLG